MPEKSNDNNPGLNPRTRLPESSMLTTRPPKPSLVALNINVKSGYFLNFITDNYLGWRICQKEKLTRPETQYPTYDPIYPMRRCCWSGGQAPQNDRKYDGQPWQQHRISKEEDWNHKNNWNNYTNIFNHCYVTVCFLWWWEMSRNGFGYNWLNILQTMYKTILTSWWWAHSARNM